MFDNNLFFLFLFQNSTQACRCLETLSKDGNYKQQSQTLMPNTEQMSFVFFVCSSDPGAADGARQRVASEGAAENLFSRVGRNTTVCTLCTPTKQCMMC